MSTLQERKVKRVLVMLEYEDESPDNGEVFDLTQLAAELLPSSSYSASIELKVEARPTWRRQPEPEFQLNASWHTWIGSNLSASCAYLADAINSALPDGERVKYLRRKADRLAKQAHNLEHQARVAKLEQVAAVRHLHPIAHVTQAVPVLAEK